MKTLLTGASGFVGGHLAPLLASRGPLFTAGRTPLPAAPGAVRHLEGDLGDPSFLSELSRLAPEAVVHLAALTDPDACETDPERARLVNAEIPERLAAAVAGSCRRFVQVSTDLVFDGERGGYSEADEPHPISVYGRTKLEGERRVRAVLGDRGIVARLALVYGTRPHASARESFLERMLQSAARGSRVALFTDEIRTPIFVEDAASSLAGLLALDTAPPVLHLGGPDRCSRFEMGTRALSAFGLASSLAERRTRSEVRTKAPRPRDVSLSSSRARSLGLGARGLEEGLRAMESLRSW